VFGTLEELLEVDFGAPLHCLAICGEIHPLEQEVIVMMLLFLYFSLAWHCLY